MVNLVISLVGNILLIIGIIGFSSIIILQLLQKQRHSTGVFFLSNFVIISAFLLLIYAFVSSDFSIKNVFLNSSTLKPLIYKIAGSWASHEGSILLYTTLLGLISSVYIKNSDYLPKTRNLQIIILATIQILFLLFIYFTSNPFAQFYFTPKQGMGLNPVLQDKALSIHPPLLYMGYVTFVANYVNGILMLLKSEDKALILKNNILFSNIALTMLTAGIGLGAWWAYRELGWGGYWFFDPVENISLMPWLIAIALHHFMLLAKKNNQYMGMVILTSILPFLLTIYGIFFVRSGIISSVHSFAFSAQRGLYLFIICNILTLPVIIICIKYLRLSIKPLGCILIANILWIIAFLILFISLIYPIYYSFIYNIDAAIDPEYFYKIFIPIFIPLMILASIAPFVQKLNFKTILCASISVFIAMVISLYAKNSNIINITIITAAIFLMLRTMDFAVIQSNFLRKSINASKLALIIGHFGFGLLAFSIATNVLFAKEVEFIGKIGEVVIKDNMNIKLNNINFSDGQGYYRQIAEFSVAQDNNIVILKPENRLYKIENTLSQESDIFSYLSYDMFAVLSKIDGEVIHAMIYYRPMIAFIWFSVFMISFAFFIRIKN